MSFSELNGKGKELGTVERSKSELSDGILHTDTLWFVHNDTSIYLCLC